MFRLLSVVPASSLDRIVIAISATTAFEYDTDLYSVQDCSVLLPLGPIVARIQGKLFPARKVPKQEAFTFETTVRRGQA